ncbi:PEP/pyruvate-binding domain-containing protein [Desulfoscipio gibsoniae]|uniref:Phosphoenolpyruvate synthase/pyruvate phosphate dikinase n=1 Tax=Desulfoscipio gibsoniae DSM 7213 TaxID=767817 RepID=R4KDQ6_9FIRM|nr:PEP/pyruvate-binding domain-containing protein [Desulfoscipio gibsoniae]AGK99816.1 phosphoenolpyruvate synthase/pyruvate phosphate dikinase [Desulfoscipio gibsoniae DSM 7213]
MSSKTKLFLNWAETYQAGPAKVGGKGWNLGRLVRYGFPVPAGGVISAEAYNLFMEENNLMSARRNLSDNITAANVGEKAAGQSLAGFRAGIISGTLPPGVEKEIASWLAGSGNPGRPLAVRSSASLEDSGVASFAGVHESFLNVTGLENITMAIKGCYASLWTPRAISYRRKFNILDEELLPAVVIMDMVMAEAAGIGFTCDPKTGRQDVLVINANYGLGESVVGGMVEPDEYHLCTDTLMPQLINKLIGKKEGKTVQKDGGGTVFLSKDTSENNKGGQVLSDEDIVKIALLIQRVFEALGGGEQHQDVEWVYNGRDFSLVQCRPVTSLPRYTYPELKGQPDYWSNANTKDALPMVLSTLTRKVVAGLIGGIVSAPFRAVGYPILPGLKYMRVYQGRVYMNMSLMQWEYFDAFGFTPAEINEIAGGHTPEIQIPPGKKDDKRAVRRRNWYKVKLMLAISKFQRKAKQEFAKTRKQAVKWFNCDLSSTSEGALLEELEKNNRLAVAYTNIPGMMNISSGFPLKMLTDTLEKSFPGKGSALANDILTGQGAITTAEHGYRLMELAETARKESAAREFFNSVNYEAFLWEEMLPDGSAFKQAFRAYLEEYGHRAVYEGDLANPRWRENPTYLLEIVRSTLNTADSAKIRAAQREKGQKAWREIRKGVSLFRRMLIRYWSGKAIRGMEMREEAKSGMVGMALPMRVIALDVGRRLTDRGVLKRKEDVFNCSFPDLAAILAGHWDGRGLAMLVKDRKVRNKNMASLIAPDVIADETPRHPNAAQVTPAKRGNSLSGIGIATGRVTGTARLISHPDEGSRLNPDEVLVAPSTDPGWTPLFIKAAALIMETGGSLSHGAIVAREFGIPAVINVPEVMKVIKDSQTVTVDGEEGKVYL